MRYVDSLWAAQTIYFDNNDWRRHHPEPIEGSLHGRVRTLADMTPEEIAAIEAEYGARVLRRA